jgi:hypothetical protein
MQKLLVLEVKGTQRELEGKSGEDDDREQETFAYFSMNV